MLLKKYFFIAAALLLSVLAGAQTKPCNTTGISPWLKWYAQNRHQLAANLENDTAWLYVPMTVHVIGEDDGAGYYALDKVFAAVCKVNENYVDARIKVYLHPDAPVLYHNNTSWYAHDWAGGDDMMVSENLPDRINAYVVDDPAGACGYYSPWLDAIALKKSCSGVDATTWAHEVGHLLSLDHPFVGWEGTTWNWNLPAPDEIDGHEVERMDGSNCEFAGDYFCDTRPDYLSDRWQCDDNSESNTLQHDPDGVEFRSDGTLIMGYSNDGCATRFTPEQIAAMRMNLQHPVSDHHSYLQLTELPGQIPEGATVELVSPVDTQSVQFNDIDLTWNLLPNASIYTVEVGFFPSMNPKLFSQTVFDNTSTVHITNPLPNNRILYWRVKAYSAWDPCGSAITTQIGVFRTGNLIAVNDLERVALAELSPNPAGAGQPSFLKITTDETMPALLQVMDAAGRSVFGTDVQLSPGENNLELPTQRLPAGLYQVVLQNEKGVISKRLAVTD